MIYSLSVTDLYAVLSLGFLTMSNKHITIHNCVNLGLQMHKCILKTNIKSPLEIFVYLHTFEDLR